MLDQMPFCAFEVLMHQLAVKTAQDLQLDSLDIAMTSLPVRVVYF